MSARATQEQRDEEARTVGLRWVEPCRTASEKVGVECLTCGHRWQTNPNNVQQGCGCPACKNRATAERRRVPVEQRHAEAAAVGARWIGEPRHNGRPALAECLTCAHRWSVTPGSIHMGTGCPKCADRIRAEKRRAPRDLRDEQAAAVGLRWIEDPAQAHRPTLAECEHGHRSRPTPANVMSGHRCIECAVSGWRDTRPGVLYVVTNPEAGRVKIGKTNAPRARMNDHRRDGFTDLVWMSDEAPGHEVSDAERVALAAIASLGVEPIRGREYFAVSPRLLVADVVEIAEVALPVESDRH